MPCLKMLKVTLSIPIHNLVSSIGKENRRQPQITTQIFHVWTKRMES